MKRQTRGSEILLYHFPVGPIFSFLLFPPIAVVLMTILYIITKWMNRALLASYNLPVIKEELKDYSFKTMLANYALIISVLLVVEELIGIKFITDGYYEIVYSPKDYLVIALTVAVLTFTLFISQYFFSARLVNSTRKIHSSDTGNPENRQTYTGKKNTILFAALNTLLIPFSFLLTFWLILLLDYLLTVF